MQFFSISAGHYLQLFACEISSLARSFVASLKYQFFRYWILDYYTGNFKVSNNAYLIYNWKKLVNTWVTFRNIFIRKKDCCGAILCLCLHHKNQTINFVFFFYWKRQLGNFLHWDRAKLLRLFQQTGKSRYFGKLNQSSIISLKTEWFDNSKLISLTYTNCQ